MPRIKVYSREHVVAGIEALLARGDLAVTPDQHSAIEALLAPWLNECAFTSVCSSGSSALWLAYKVLGSRRVAVPAITFWATATMALDAGASVLLVPVTDSGHIDVDALECLSPDEIDTVAYVSLGGWPDPRRRRLVELCRSRGWKLVEDAAQALGLGTVGQDADAVCLSFYASKVVTCGEGGAVAFRHRDQAQRAKVLGDHGKIPPMMDRPGVLGVNARMTSVQAAVLIGQLEALPTILQERRAVIARYTNLPRTTLGADAASNGYKLVVPSFPNPPERMVQDSPVYRVPLTIMPLLLNHPRVAVADGDYTATGSWASTHLALPCWADVDPSIVDSWNRYFAGL